jgi:hypothetical protein
MTNVPTNCATFFLYAYQLHGAMHAVALDEAQLLEDQIFVHYPTCFMFLSKKQKLTYSVRL